MITKAAEPIEHEQFNPIIGVLNEQPWIDLLRLNNIQVLRLMYCFVVKPALDMLFACLLLLLLSPLLLVISLVIWLEMGRPIIFGQERVGKRGRVFTMYKFRSMCPDRRKHTTAVFEGERRKTHKVVADPRITRVGRFLRQTSMDELPQLFNILRGEMSFIGPRPELPTIVDRYESWQHDRHLVMPGLSGWWQIRGRSSLLMHEHTELDLYYVANQSLWLDIRILIGTFGAVIKRTGAF